ncbi:MAG TPA: D-alanyl-D-alanine carboxypeptidase/D-alanyl-D-alanine-endopeptidase, partial [Candidatus Sumerlaeia bacterium]|nr:D-alanyl-D-alanine carboxypeptidase/D-alanyl-D-alanine-endopeptidase [Candidatus Sumerlaeia bacterium]
MKRLFTIGGSLILMTLITAAIPAADMTAAITKNQLRQNIEKILSRDDVASATVGVCILAGDTGDILYEKNGEVPLKPASCNKLQVTAAALHFLGPDYTYKTSLQITGKIRNKTLVGDVIVSGSGDPSISGRFGKDKSDNTAIFRDWAKALKRMGIEKIEGNIVGDDDYFGDDTFGQGWSPNSRGSWFSAEVSALSFNDNCVDVVWSGNGAVGKTAPYKLNPPTSYVKITNEVRIGKKGTDKTSSFHRKDKSNEIVARGMIPKGGTMSDSAAVYNPTHYFVSVLKETLEKERIPVMGKAIDLDDEPELKKALQEDPPTTTVATYESPRLIVLLDVVNTNSQNLFAELILKTIGKKIKGEGTFLASSEAVMEFLRKEKLWDNGSLIIDGSGLSHLNRASAHQLACVLRYMSQQPWWKDVLGTMPRGQMKGYLKKCFGESAESREIGKRIYGKTGNISGVIGLSGVVYNENNREIFYSVLINNYRGATQRGREIGDAIAFEAARSRLP